MCFGGRKTREERKLCLKIHLIGFPQRLVTGQSTTAARKLVSLSTLIGPFEFDRALATPPSNQSWRWNQLASGRCWLFLFSFFADDTYVFYSHENLKTLELIVNAELNNLFNRLTSNKLTRKDYGSQTLANCSWKQFLYREEPCSGKSHEFH